MRLQIVSIILLLTFLRVKGFQNIISLTTTIENISVRFDCIGTNGVTPDGKKFFKILESEVKTEHEEKKKCETLNELLHKFTFQTVEKKDENFVEITVFAGFRSVAGEMVWRSVVLSREAPQFHNAIVGLDTITFFYDSSTVDKRFSYSGNVEIEKKLSGKQIEKEHHLESGPFVNASDRIGERRGIIMHYSSDILSTTTQENAPIMTVRCESRFAANRIKDALLKSREISFFIIEPQELDKDLKPFWSRIFVFEVFVEEGHSSVATVTFGFSVLPFKIWLDINIRHKTTEEWSNMSVEATIDEKIHTIRISQQSEAYDSRTAGNSFPNFKDFFEKKSNWNIEKFEIRYKEVTGVLPKEVEFVDANFKRDMIGPFILVDYKLELTTV